MNEYIYSDSNREENEVKNYYETLLFPIIVILFLISIGLNIFCIVSSKNTIAELNDRHLNEMIVLSDSLTNELDFIKTQLEVKSIHEIYGKISISKEMLDDASIDDVWNFILSLNVWYPEYIMAQAIVESGCGELMPANSNNMFGMKVPKTRESVAINKGSDEVYAKYKNWKESVIDRVLWELNVFNYIKPTEEEYLAKIKKYATSETYLNAINSVAKRYKQ